jgi:hypothetical protein
MGCSIGDAGCNGSEKPVHPGNHREGVLAGADRGGCYTSAQAWGPSAIGDLPRAFAISVK